MSSVVRLYCAGGAAFNIASDIISSHRHKSDSLLANLAISLIDTSESNYNRNKELFTSANIQPTYIPDLDGAGQNRQAIAPKVITHIPSILRQNPPGDLNIVIHSASGGK